MKDNIKLILLALFLFAGQSAWAEIITGECGQESGKMFYSLNTKTGELYIWGEGYMLDQQFEWDSYKKQIKSVYIDGKVSSIGVDAFSDCTNLTNVVIAIPATLDEIGDYAFQNCKSLKDFTMLCDDIDFVSCEYHNSNRYSFDGASTDVTLHCTENYLANESDCFEPGHEFGGWKHDTHLSGKNRFGVTWDYEDHTLTLGGVETLGYENWVDEPVWQDLFNDYEMTTKLVIGGGVKTIDDYSFSNASFQELVLDEGVRTVGEYAFGDNYSLQKVTLASTVETIKSEAFNDCEALSYIQLNYTGRMTFNTDCFSGVADEGTIAIPVGGFDYNITAFGDVGLPIYDEYNNITDNWTIKFSYDSPNLTLQHGLSYDVEEEREMTSLYYNRHIGRSEVGQWLPLCVPFSFYQSESNSDYDIAKIHDIMPTKDTNMNGQIDTYDEINLALIPFTGITEPNNCYMIRPKRAGAITIIPSANTLYPAEQTTVEFSTSRNRFVITNVYEDHTISQDDNYFCVRGGLLVHPKNGGTVEPFAWVLRAEKRNTAGQRFIDNLKKNPIKVVVMGEELEESSISSLTNLIDDLNNFHVPFQKMSEDQIEETVNDVLKKKN